MKHLIAYYSFTGNNRILAAEIAAKLSAELFEIKELNNRTWATIIFDMLFNRRPKIQYPLIAWENYDYTLLIAPVWNAKIANPMCTFINEVKAHLTRYAFLTVCGGREGQSEKLRNQLTKLTGRQPITFAELAIKECLPEERQKEDNKSGIVTLMPGDIQYFSEKIDQLLRNLNVLEKEY